MRDWCEYGELLFGCVLLRRPGDMKVDSAYG